MPLKINVINCPSCGAAIPIQEGTSQITCSYCGSKFTITNENEFVYRHVDEAKMKIAETERMKWQYEKEQKEKRQKYEQIKLLVIIAIVAGLLFIAAIGYLFGDSNITFFGLMGAIIFAEFSFIYYMGNKDKEQGLNNTDTSNNQPLRTLVFKEELVPDHHFCGHCGAKLKANAKFCHKCGHIVAKLPMPPKAGKQNRKVR